MEEGTRHCQNAAPVAPSAALPGGAGPCQQAPCLSISMYNTIRTEPEAEALQDTGGPAQRADAHSPKLGSCEGALQQSEHKEAAGAARSLSEHPT